MMINVQDNFFQESGLLEAELLGQYRSRMCQANANSELPGTLRIYRNDLAGIEYNREKFLRIGAAIAIDIFNDTNLENGCSEAYGLFQYCTDQLRDPYMCHVAAVLCRKCEDHQKAQAYAQKGIDSCGNDFPQLVVVLNAEKREARENANQKQKILPSQQRIQDQELIADTPAKIIIQAENDSPENNFEVVLNIHISQKKY